MRLQAKLCMMEKSESCGWLKNNQGMTNYCNPSTFDCAAESGRTKKRRPKRLQNLNDNDHGQQRDSKRPRSTPAANRSQADAVQASGRPSGPWTTRRVPSPRVRGIHIVLHCIPFCFQPIE